MDTSDSIDCILGAFGNAGIAWIDWLCVWSFGSSVEGAHRGFVGPVLCIALAMARCCISARLLANSEDGSGDEESTARGKAGLVTKMGVSAVTDDITLRIRRELLCHLSGWIDNGNLGKVHCECGYRPEGLGEFHSDHVAKCIVQQLGLKLQLKSYTIPDSTLESQSRRWVTEWEAVEPESAVTPAYDDHW